MSNNNSVQKIKISRNSMNHYKKKENEGLKKTKNQKSSNSINFKIKRNIDEKKLLNEAILRRKEKNSTNLNTTRENTLTSESTKKSNYYDKFVNNKYPTFSAEEMSGKLKEEKSEDMEFLYYILYNIFNNNNNYKENKEILINSEDSENNDIIPHKIKTKENRYDFNIIRKYIIKMQIIFIKEAEETIRKNKYNQNFLFISFFMKILETLIARYSLIIFLLIKNKKSTQAKDIFLLMIKENYIYIQYIEKSIIEWYSVSNKKINISKEFPKLTYELIQIYSFIIKYSQYFNMMNYSNIFLGRYLDVIYFIYNFFIYKSTIRGLTLDTKNQINYFLSLSLHYASYNLIFNYSPLNLSIYFNNFVFNLYKHSDENNLTRSEKSLIIKVLYNLGLFLYLNGEKDKAIDYLTESKEMLLNMEDNDTFKNNKIKLFGKKEEILSVFRATYDKYLTKKIDTILLNKEKKIKRFSNITCISENDSINNKKEESNTKISKETIKTTYYKEKINTEDIQTLINYGIKIGLINENNSGKFKINLRISPTNKSPKYKLKYISIPKFFLNPLLRKIELFMGEIELNRKNYNSSYEHILKVFYILISLKLNQKGSENVMFNTEQKIIQKYLELISKLKDKQNRYDNNKKRKTEINLPLLNQSETNNIYEEESSDSLMDKYKINKNINTEYKGEKKKKEILISGNMVQDYKIIKEIEKFFVFLNTLSLYQIKILNETQPDNNKRNDLPILFSSQFKDCLTNMQKIKLENLQTMALNRFIILKNENKWIIPNNLNIGIIDEKKMKNYLRKKTIKFINKCVEKNKNVIPIQRTREYKHFQKIIKSNKINKEMKTFLKNNINIAFKLLKKIEDDDINNVISSPNIICDSIKLFLKKRKNKLKKENLKQFNNKNNYDFDDDYNSNNINKNFNRSRTRAFSSEINLKKFFNFQKRNEEKTFDDSFMKFRMNKEIINNSIQFDDIENYKNEDLKDYNDSYQDYLLSPEGSYVNNDISIDNNENNNE